MTHRNLKIRPAMTAIAAVLALSTPSFAQSAGEPIAVTSAPAIEVTSAPPAADPIAPEAAAQPAARKATPVRSTVARPDPVEARAAPALATASVRISDPDADARVEPLPVQPEVAPVQAPVADPPIAPDTTMSDSMTPMIAGAAALGILALVGTGLVVRRRRRRAEDAHDAERRDLAGTDADADRTQINESELEPARIDEPQPEPATPAMVAETAAVAAAVVAAHEPSPEIDGPVTELPEEFDTSHLGLHAQAAYNGPTEDNPSLSLKHRLSRANGMDQLAEREAETEVAAAPVEALAANPPVARSAKGGSMLGSTDTKPSPEPSVLPA